MKDPTEYIVGALIEQSLYREGAENIVAEHDAIKRAEVLNEAADDLVSACPDHGSGDEAWMDCPCEYADELRRKAALSTPAVSS